MRSPKRGWQKVVAFQTRNPMHRAHEELCRMAMERLNADGLVIHMLLGKLKPGDIPAPVRDAAIRKMVELYFPPNSATDHRLRLRHALRRAARGGAARRLPPEHGRHAPHRRPRPRRRRQTTTGRSTRRRSSTTIPTGALKIEIFRADNTAYSKKLNKVVMMREAPGHTKEDFVNLSGTKVREMLGQGIAPPPEFARPEVAQILIDYYRSTEQRAN